MCAPVLHKVTVGSSVTVDIQDPIKLDKKLHQCTFRFRDLHYNQKCRKDGFTVVNYLKCSYYLRSAQTK
jgi:hypothetical protein